MTCNCSVSVTALRGTFYGPFGVCVGPAFVLWRAALPAAATISHTIYLHSDYCAWAVFFWGEIFWRVSTFCIRMLKVCFFPSFFPITSLPGSLTTSHFFSHSNRSNQLELFLGGIKNRDNISQLQKQKNAPISCYYNFHVSINGKGGMNVTFYCLNRGKKKSWFYLTNIQFEHLPEYFISILHNQHFWADIMYDERDGVVLMTLKKEQIHHISSKH